MELHLTNTYGCDSIHTITTTLLPSSETSELLSSCNPSDTGVVILHFTSQYGCDSTHTVTTTLLPSSATAEFLTSCNPADTGVVELHLINTYGCDSTHTVTTTLLPSSATAEFLTSCNPADTGVVILHFTNQYGCDSTHTITTTLVPSIETSELLSSCNPADTGVVILHFTSQYGCDSTHTVTTTLLPSSATTEFLTSCNPADTGVVELHLTNTYGCDSIHTITTTLLPSIETSELLSSCNPADTGVIILHFTSQYGCDSTHTVTTTLLPSSATAEFLTSCNPADTGVVELHLINTYGCDSTHTVTTTLLPSSATTEFLTSCNPADTGVVELHLTNTYGCDSTHTITTTLVPSIETSELLSSCNPADTGVVILHFTSQYGCDSTHTIVTALLPISNSITDANICFGNSYAFNGIDYSTAGTYVDTLTGSNGCDSLATLVLTVAPGGINAISASICQDSTYLFNNRSLTLPGVYYDTIISPQGCYSFTELTLTVNSSYKTFDTVSICSGSSYDYFGMQLSTPGDYNHFMQTQFGCDSVNYLHLLINVPDKPMITRVGDTLFSSGTGSHQWYINDTLLSGATDSTLEILQNGYYTVQRVDSNGCTGASDSLLVNDIIFTHVKETEVETVIGVYPNPTKGNFIVECNLPLSTEIYIVDAIGRLVSKAEMRAGKAEINASALSDGVYLQRIYTGRDYKTIKLIVAK
ncbi:MAG: T9SS type A sorting domain-containing protein [Bacteroidetes bacterium]|nr:T9SS type A sorting domain-containing protein [Bacteroidota bacterium]